MKIMLSSLILLTVFWVNGPALAEKVGQAIVDGRIVILNSDGTWHFRDEAPPRADCDRVSSFTLCIDKSKWSQLPKSGDFSAMYSRDNRYYFGVIAEPAGRNQGLREQVLQKVILENAARGGNTTVDNVTVFQVYDRLDTALGLRGVIYSVVIDGLPIVYYNAFRVYENQSVQFIFWMLGQQPEPGFENLVMDTLRNIARDG